MGEFPQSYIEVVHGRTNDDEHHYWVEVDGLVFDITADQFPEISKEFYGLETNPLLKEFHNIEKKLASVAMLEYEGVETERRDAVYKKIKLLLKK